MTQDKFSAYTPERFRKTPYWDILTDEDRHVFDVTTLVLPFRVNDFVLENLVDWGRYNDDPMYRLLFPQKGMLSDDQFQKVFQGMKVGGAALS